MARRFAFAIAAVVAALGVTACTSTSKQAGLDNRPSSTPTASSADTGSAPATAEGEPRISSASVGMADSALILTLTFDGPVQCGEAAASHVQLEVPGKDASGGDFGSCSDNTMTVVFRGLSSPEGESITAHYKSATTPGPGNAVYRDTSTGRLFAADQSITVD